MIENRKNSLKKGIKQEKLLAMRSLFCFMPSFGEPYLFFTISNVILPTQMAPLPF